MTTPAPKPLRIFCSYSHKDEEYLNVLRNWLRGLERQRFIDWWHDREISPGWEWEEAIDKNLRSADIILLLVTPDFMASDYVYEKEIDRAIERHERGEARVIPIIVRPADWEWASFGKLQALPKDAKPVTTWPNQDEAWLDVLRGIRKAVEELLAERRERAAKERYRKMVEETWADKQLDDEQVEQLDTLASDLGLSADTAADIEHKVLENTKEAILERQEQAAREIAEIERRKRLDERYTEARRLHDARDWQAVVNVFEQIRAEDPTYPDREGLLASAHEALKTQQERERRETAKHTAERTPKPTKQAPPRDRLKSICDQYVEDRFYVRPNIPSAKERAARSSFVPATEPELIALYDNTLLKRGKAGFAVGSLGLYARYWPFRPSVLSWEQLASASILSMETSDAVLLEASGVPPDDKHLQVYIYPHNGRGQTTLYLVISDILSLVNPS